MGSLELPQLPLELQDMILTHILLETRFEPLRTQCFRVGEIASISPRTYALTQLVLPQMISHAKEGRESHYKVRAPGHVLSMAEMLPEACNVLLGLDMKAHQTKNYSFEALWREMYWALGYAPGRVKFLDLFQVRLLQKRRRHGLFGHVQDMMVTCIRME